MCVPENKVDEVPALCQDRNPEKQFCEFYLGTEGERFCEVGKDADGNNTCVDSAPRFFVDCDQANEKLAKHFDDRLRFHRACEDALLKLPDGDEERRPLGCKFLTKYAFRCGGPNTVDALPPVCTQRYNQFCDEAGLKNCVPAAEGYGCSYVTHANCAAANDYLQTAGPLNFPEACENAYKSPVPQTGQPKTLGCEKSVIPGTTRCVDAKGNILPCERRPIAPLTDCSKKADADGNYCAVHDNKCIPLASLPKPSTTGDPFAGMKLQDVLDFARTPPPTPLNPAVQEFLALLPEYKTNMDKVFKFFQIILQAGSSIATRKGKTTFTVEEAVSELGLKIIQVSNVLSQEQVEELQKLPTTKPRNWAIKAFNNLRLWTNPDKVQHGLVQLGWSKSLTEVEPRGQIIVDFYKALYNNITGELRTLFLKI
jgi:hypothetical protein